MPNPLYNAIGGAIQKTPLGNMTQMLHQFNQFKSQFKGDPRQKVQELLNSGQMTQAQYQQIQQAAKQIQQFLN